MKLDEGDNMKDEVKSSKNIKIAAILSYIIIFINIAFGVLFIPLVIKTVGKK